jgi:Fe-S cluster biogenesis protein NfuA/nitrite reductase/ring-hydroxylating ferredoxin subunit
MSAVEHQAPEQLFERVQELQERLDTSGDPATRELADELTAALVQMYGAGLERIVSGLMNDEEGQRLAFGLAEDPVIATLMLIHDVHPVPLEQRVAQALDSVRPYMESHGGNVELLSVDDGVARIHLRGSCSDCSASSVTLELAVNRALEEAAPDLVGLEVEGMAPQMPGLGLPMATGTGGTALPMVMSDGSGVSAPVLAAPSAPVPPKWVELDVVAGLGPGDLTGVTVSGGGLVVANVEGTLLAYRDRCTGCGAALHDGALINGALACPSCQRSYFLPRAGRSLDDDQLQLEPVPLLREADHVKVALVTS